MFEKPPQNLRREAPRQETERERKARLGLESEWTIVSPIFNELKEAGVFLYTKHTTPIVDREKGVDFVWGLKDGSHLAVQISLGESPKTWEKKIDQVIGEMGGRPYEELKDIHPEPDSLKRMARIEKTPKILLKLDWEMVNNAYRAFEKAGGKGSPFDFLPAKKEIGGDILSQALNILDHLSLDKEVAKRFPDLPALAKQRREVLGKSALEFLNKRV